MKKVLYISPLFALFILILVNSACEDFKEENLKVSEIDTEARYLLSVEDSVLIKIIPRALTAINSNWTMPQVLDSLSSVFAELEARNIDIIMQDSCYLVKTDASLDTIYILFKNNENDELIFYMNEYLEFHIYDKEGSLLETSESMIPLESLAAAGEYNKSKLDIIVKTRAEYDLNNGNYLLQLIELEEGIKDIRLVVKKKN